MKIQKNMKNKLTRIIISTIILLIVIITQLISFPKEVTATEDYQGFRMELESVTTLNKGDTVKLKIYTDGEPIQSIDAYFEYDFSIFEQITEDDITLFKKYWRVDSIEYDEEIHGENTAYIIIANNETISDTGHIATITLTLKKDIEQTSITLYDIFVVKEDFTSVGPLDGITVEIKEPEKYQIIYNENTTDKVDGMPDNEEKTENVDYTVKGTPVREGYTFKGWNTSKDGNGTNYVAGEIYSTNAELTLYAKWEKILVQTTLTVDPNGGVWEGSSNIQTFKEFEDTTKEINNPTSTPMGNIIKLNSNGGQVDKLQLEQSTTFTGWTGTTLINGTTYTFGKTDATITANYEGNSVTLPAATKTGTTFLGWYDAQGNLVGNAGDTYTPEYTTPNATIILIAKYEEKTYTLTIDSNGGVYAGNTTVQGVYESTVTVKTPTKTGYKVTLDNNDGTGTTTVKTQNYTFYRWNCTTGTINGNIYKFAASNATIVANYIEEAVQLQSATRTGYTFTGWYTEPSCLTKVNNNYMPTSNITLYARWEANIYTITFELGINGTVNPTSKQVTYGGTYGTLPIPTKPGYTFKGWKYNGAFVNETDIVNIASDITLVAEWEGNEYILTFDYDGGTGNVTNKNIKNGEPYGQLPEATKEGYDFIGWYDQNGNKVESTDIVNVTSDITLTAKYETKKYFITFKNDDGTEIKTIKVEHGTQATFTGDLPEKPGVADGYKATFTGWDNEEALQNVTQDLILTATYEVSPIVYTITYYNLKEADNSSNPTTYTIEDQSFDLEELEDQGKYLFMGWFTSNEENAVEVTSIDTSKLGNIVLYAKWLNDELYLSSEKYKVGENDIDNYEDGDIYLDKIEPETTVEELIANCDTNGVMTVIDTDGNILEEDDLVGTGMTIKVTKDDEQITLTAIVMGDLNGDGKVTATDLSTLNQTIIYRKTLEEVRFKAADLDDNIKLTATDLSTINQSILDVIKLTYTKNTNDN